MSAPAARFLNRYDRICFKHCSNLGSPVKESLPAGVASRPLPEGAQDGGTAHLWSAVATPRDTASALTATACMRNLDIVFCQGCQARPSAATRCPRPTFLVALALACVLFGFSVMWRRPRVRLAYLMWRLRSDNVQVHEPEPWEPFRALPTLARSSTMREIASYGWKALPAVIDGLTDSEVQAACLCIIADIYIEENGLKRVSPLPRDAPRARRISEYPPFAALLRSPSEPGRLGALSLLFMLHEPLAPAQVERLAEAARTDDSPHVRALALLVLAEEQHTDLLALIRSCLEPGEPAEVRLSAMLSLRALPRDVALGIYRSYADDPYTRVAVHATAGLVSECGDLDAVAGLFGFLDAADTHTRMVAVTALCSVTDRQPVAATLLDSDSGQATSAAWSAWWRDATDAEREREREEWRELWRSADRAARRRAAAAWRQWWEREGRAAFEGRMGSREDPLGCE